MSPWPEIKVRDLYGKKESGRSPLLECLCHCSHQTIDICTKVTLVSAGAYLCTERSYHVLLLHVGYCRLNPPPLPQQPPHLWCQSCTTLWEETMSSESWPGSLLDSRGSSTLAIATPLSEEESTVPSPAPCTLSVWPSCSPLPQKLGTPLTQLAPPYAPTVSHGPFEGGVSQDSVWYLFPSSGEKALKIKEEQFIYPMPPPCLGFAHPRTSTA
jgi:hypothetical protein